MNLEEDVQTPVENISLLDSPFNYHEKKNDFRANFLCELSSRTTSEGQHRNEQSQRRSSMYIAVK